jgi:CRISPR-associated protein Cas2
MGMVVMVLQRVPPRLRGELTRWMIEPQVGVFVGTLSAMVRDKLWEKTAKALDDGGAMQLWSTNNEQGFAVRTAGTFRREVVDWHGLQLVRTLHADRATEDAAPESA